MQNGANLQQAGGAHLLIMAVRKKNSAIVRCLLQAGADPRIPDSSGVTVLHLAAGATFSVTFWSERNSFCRMVELFMRLLMKIS